MPASTSNNYEAVLYIPDMRNVFWLAVAPAVKSVTILESEVPLTDVR